MFKCEICEKIVPPSTPATRMTVKTQEALYPSRKDANRYKAGRRYRTSDDRGGIGSQIVKEVMVCPRCAKEYNQRNYV